MDYSHRSNENVNDYVNVKFNFDCLSQWIARMIVSLAELSLASLITPQKPFRTT